MTNPNMFDVNTFLETVFDQPSETESIPCPAGEYPALITKVDARVWKGKEDPSKSGVVMDVVWEILDEGVRETCKKDKVSVRQSIMFNFTLNEMGQTVLDMEKAKQDVKFGRLRAAIGLNDGAFSPSQLLGQTATVKVGHRAVDGVIFADVKDVASA